MELMSEDSGFTVSWLLGLSPPDIPLQTSPTTTSSSSSPGGDLSDVQNRLLAFPEPLQPQPTPKHLLTSPGTALPQKPSPLPAPSPLYTSTDPTFSITWLLGLRQAPLFERYPWAAQYYCKDPSFRVSGLLGLVPCPRQRTGTTEMECPEKPEYELVVTPEPSESGDSLASYEEGLLDPFAAGNGLDTFGLTFLFGEDETKQEEAAGKEGEEEAEKPGPCEPEFMDLLGSLELLISDIQAQGRLDNSDNESLDGLSPEEVEDESPSRLEWLRQKSVERAENKILDRLMSVPGLEEVKELFLNAKAKVQAATRRETPLRKENFDVVFAGPQGTGKSLVARLYAKFLVSLGVVNAVPPTYAGWQTYSAYGMSKTGTLDSIKLSAASCKGLVAIIEDAHLLNKDPLNLWNFYVRAQDLANPVVLIFVGDMDLGLAGLLSYRARAEHHFPVLKLPSYTEEQLQIIFHGMVRVAFNKKMRLEGEGAENLYVRILMRRLRRGTGEKSFGNVWAVRKAFVDVCKRQVERFRQARKQGHYLEDWQMTKEDLLGKKPSLSPDKSPAWKELQDLIGLGAVKESIEAVVHQVNQNYQREMKGDEPLPITVNKVFLGSPGTGKTTVAKLYGRILADLGILSKGDLIVKNPSDLIDQYVGGSECRTKDALAHAKGSVLIIDDAHMLDPGPGQDSQDRDGQFRNAVLDTLTAEISGLPGEDRCVILCGYPDQMRALFQHCNPGFARRFPLDQAFVFENFTSEELQTILDAKLKKERLLATDTAKDVVREMLTRAAVRPNFGNGGEVDSILAKAISGRTRRLTKKGLSDEDNWDDIPLEPEDFDPEWDRHTRAVANTRELFKDFIGYEEIISKFESYQYMVQGMRLRNVDPRPYIPFTYVFKGPPGTGKTTTARKLGQIFYDMGFLAAPEVIEVSASQLIGEYCGQTGPKTTRLLTSALGKVLFIDEAYRLASPGQFTQEAVTELVDAVTKPQFARKLIIVLAGYEEDMDRLLRSNQGMRSRFPTEFSFRPMRAEQCVEQLRRVVSKVGITIQPTAEMDSATRNNLMGALQRMTTEKSWASGRSVETLGEKLIGHIFKECAVRGYTGAELRITGKEMVTILSSSVMGTPGLKIWTSGGPMGARAVMTLKDLESEGHN